MSMLTARRIPVVVAILGLLSVAITWWPGELGWGQSSPRSPFRSMAISWPSQGQSALAIPGAGHRVSDQGAQPVPIASVAKVMTAYVVLARFPLSGGQAGFTVTFSAADADEAATDARQGQSAVPVAAGEEISERQALEGLLLPSANNYAMALADRVAGSVSAFVDLMNAQAVELGMRHTTYTDPSGFAASTVSTAADQLRLARAAFRDPALSEILQLRQAVLPVAGTVRNTDRLVGHDGIVGGKTGSDAAAGGCFMFKAQRRVGGRSVTVFGVVLGQRAGPLIEAGLFAADDLLNDVVARLAVRTEGRSVDGRR